MVLFIIFYLKHSINNKLYIFSESKDTKTFKFLNFQVNNRTIICILYMYIHYTYFIIILIVLYILLHYIMLMKRNKLLT